MAIYSLHHGNVGKATQKLAGTAGAHVHYITRTGAARLVMGEHMPTDRDQARAWVDEREATDRKNGRVIDKLMVALPLELDGQQRADLVREFVAEIGGGRVSWLAAIHDRGEDAQNPHAHVILRDKDHDTGKRVFGTSEKGSTDRLREIWETVANRVLEREGHEARIDRRSLADQGLAREAGIHVGPNVHAMEERGLRPESIAQDHTTSRGNERVVNWPEIDQGRTRADRQREIKAMNREAEADRGKQKGEQQAELVPAEIERERVITSPALEIDQLHQLEELIPQLAPEPGRDIIELVPAMQPEREAQGPGRVMGGMDVAGQVAEATQRASYEVAIPEPVREPIEIRLERSRLAQIITLARERLASLANRLEQAFQAVRQHFQAQQIEDRQPIRVEIRQPEKLLEDLRPEKAAAADPWAKLIEDGRKLRAAAADKSKNQEKAREDLGRSLWSDFSQGRDRKGPGF